MTSDETRYSRRKALQCMASAGAGTLFVLSGGVLTPIDLAQATEPVQGKRAGKPLFIQVSDTHIGFNKDANPDVGGTLTQTIQYVNALPQRPAFVIHTGDISHFGKPAELDTAQQLLSQLHVREIHTVPGEHDITDPDMADYLARFGRASGNKGYYSFDHAGVHFVGLINVRDFKPGGLGLLGAQQLAWVEADLKARSDSTPIVVFAHMPLWTIYEPWGWGTGDAGQLMTYLGRFGSVTVLNGHIHQIVQKVEGHITFHTARSTAFPLPQAGVGPGPAPLKVAADELPRMLGITSVSASMPPGSLSLTDKTLA